MAPKKKTAAAVVPATDAPKSTGKKARKAKAAESRPVVMHNGALHFQNTDGSHVKLTDAEIRAQGFTPEAK